MPLANVSARHCRIIRHHVRRPILRTVTGFLGGFAAALVGGAIALGLVALVGVFHKAINVYRGAGLLTVLLLMASVATFSYRLIAHPDLASPFYIGLFIGLGVTSITLLAKARVYVPLAMLPPPPPPTLGSGEPDVPVVDPDPFT